jgi:tetratricopeptide (TPR) repeat protein
LAWQGDRWAYNVLQVSRRRAGGVLTVWQNLRDRNDVPGLVAFAASADALDLGPEQICQLGQDLATAKQHAPRLALLRRSVERYPMHVWSRYDLMLTCQAQSPPLNSEALQHAAALTALRPDSARFQCDLGQCLNSVGAREPAEAVLRRAIALGPKYAQSYIALGILLRNTGDLNGAIDCFKELIHQVPQNQWGHANLGYILYMRKDYEGAAAGYKEALRIDPKSAKLRTEFGMILHAKKDLNGAVEQYLEAIRLDPRNGAHQDGLGRVLQAQGDVNGAYVHFQQAMRLSPNDPTIRNDVNQALNRRVDTLLDKRDVNGAIASLREAIRFDPNNADYHNKVAWFLATGPDRPGNGKQAITYAATACVLTNWKDPLLIDTLAAAHAAAGDFDKAVEYQKKALSMPTLDKKLIPGAQDRMLLYSQKQPYRDPGLAPRDVAPPPREVKR